MRISNMSVDHLTRNFETAETRETRIEAAAARRSGQALRGPALVVVHAWSRLHSRNRGVLQRSGGGKTDAP